MRLSKISSNYFLTIICILSLCLLLVACQPKQEAPFPKGLPSGNIVFMPESDPTGGAQNVSKTLGFINADGTNRQEYSFVIVGSSYSNFGRRNTTKFAAFPRWSKSGDNLLFAIFDVAPNIRLIDTQGNIYGEGCDMLEYSGVFDNQGNVFGRLNKWSQNYESYKNLLVRYNLKTCKVISAFPLPIASVLSVSEVNEASNGLLAAKYYVHDQQEILLYNQLTDDSRSFPGYHPSLSEDGAWLAYFNPDGNLAVINTKSGTEKVLTHVFSVSGYEPERYLAMPGWSSDNKWLVYNTVEGKIYKINIETGENIYLTDGWAPDWR